MACELIAQELEEARGLAHDLFSQWHAATGKKKSRLFFLWRAANTTVARLRVEYENCLNPPALLPDLVPVGVSRSRSVPITEPAFDAAVVINNQGAASAVGPFNRCGVRRLQSGSTATGLPWGRAGTFLSELSKKQQGRQLHA